MASNNVREIRTRLSLDGETAFRKSLKSVDSSLSAMKAEMKNLSTSFDESTDAMTKNEKKSEILKRMQEQMKIKVDALAGAVDESKEAYEEARKKAEELTKEYGETSEKAKIAWAEVETLGNKMDRMATLSFNAQSKLNDVDKQLRDLETPLKNASEKADDATENIDDMGKKAEESANDGFTVLKGAAADLVSKGLSKVFDMTKDVIAEFGNLDTVTNNFAIKTGASAAEMQGYSDSLNSLYNKGIGDSLGGISDNMAIVKQSLRDLPTDSLEEVTEYVLSLEDAFGYDAAESMRAANSLVDQFEIAYSDVFDLIVQGAQSGLDQNGDMLDTFNEYSVQFKDMGYTAEEMFNMLSNAAETGTWSVGKLGDAVKEFNIKLSEGSADEALAKLGFGTETAAADAEAYAKASENLEKSETALRNAEVNLEKVRISAIESENAYNEALNEHGENSLEAQKALANMNSAYNSLKNAEDAVTSAQKGITEAQSEQISALNATETSVESIKLRLAEGGVSAKMAQQEIINALMSVEDEQERYVLGQQLMGTMWEDLGETTVAALFNTQGEISTTKDAMQEVIDLKYDDLGSRIEAVGRKAKTEIAEPLIEKYIPKIEKGLEFVTENLDEIIDTAEVVGKVIVTAFAVKKVFDFGNTVSSTVKSFIGIVKNLTTATQGQAAANMALNATNPWGWVALAVAGVGALTVAIVENYQSYDDMVAEAAKLTNAEQEIRDRTQEVVDKYKDWKTAQENITLSKDAEFGYYDELWDELQDIVDQNGNIKRGYEERADFITNRLGEVTGVEIQIVDGAIQKYAELRNTIDEVLKKKKAEAYLGAYQSSYNDAMQNEQSAYKNMIDNKKLLDDQRAQLLEYTERAAKLKKQMDYTITIKDPSTSATVYNEARIGYESVLAKIEGLSQKIKEQEQAASDAEETYMEYANTISNYESLDEAVFSGDTTNMNIALAKLKYGFKDATNATKEELEEQRKNYQNLLKQMENDLKTGMPGVTQESVNQMKMLVQATNTEIAHAAPKYKETSAASVLSLVSGIKEKSPDTITAMQDLSNGMTGVLYANGGNFYNAGQQNGTDYIAGLKTAVNGLALDINGHSVWSPLAQFALPHFATGTDNFKGGFAVINENQKGELVNLPNGSQVIPHDISLKYAEEAASRASVTNNTFGNININISAPNLNGQASARAVAFEISDKVVSQIAEKIDRQKNRYSSAIGR